MSISVRLSVVGKRGRPIYRIVVSEKRAKRDGKALDILGFYNPNVKPPILEIDQKKLEAWTKKGAALSAGLHRLLKPETK